MVSVVRIDLHTHSNRSDGTEDPAELMASAAAAKLDVVALTDHDTVSGWVEAADAAEATGVALVRGAEISCSVGGITVHLLAYLFDPEDEALAKVFKDTRDSRDNRAVTMVERLGHDYPIRWQDIVDQVEPGATIGRPHIADALVSKGIVSHRGEAFEELLHPRNKYYVHNQTADPVDVVRMVRAAGGVSVFAHPGASVRGRTVGPEVIEAMARAGMAGLEIEHRDNTADAKVRLRALAKDLGLVTTGSSDYHGTGKPNLLGENLTDPRVLEFIESEGKLEVIRP